MKDMGTASLTDDQIASYSSKGPHSNATWLPNLTLWRLSNLIDSVRSQSSNLLGPYPSGGNRAEPVHEYTR